MKTPSITPAQIKAVVLALVGILAALGLPIGQEKQEAILRLVEILPTVLILADAVIRYGRASNAEAVLKAKAIQAAAELAAAPEKSAAEKPAEA